MDWKMIENEETLKYVIGYFDAIKKSLPVNSKFKYASKYTKGETNSHYINTDDKPMSGTDSITIYYESGTDSKNNCFKIGCSAIAAYLRNKKLEQIGI